MLLCYSECHIYFIEVSLLCAQIEIVWELLSTQWFELCFALAHYNFHLCNMRDIEHALIFTHFGVFKSNTLSRLCEVYFAKHVIQASTASSHRVGKCIFEPSKQSRIRKSSFWSHRRSTVQWETALSSKERSRRVNCPMLVPYNLYLCIYHCYYHALSTIYNICKFTHTYSTFIYSVTQRIYTSLFVVYSALIA